MSVERRNPTRYALVREREDRLDSEDPMLDSENPTTERLQLPSNLSLLTDKLGQKARQGPRLRFYAVYDGVVQPATRLMWEPIFEADFLDCSYGFRPERSAHQALEAIRANLADGFREVYDADLQGYFDSIPHDKLMACLRMRIADRTVLKLIRMWLETPVVEETEDNGTKVTRPEQGTPQGGGTSPLLAHIYLHLFYHRFHAQQHPTQWARRRLGRYADNFIVLASPQSPQL